jgi:hypothetical protein
LIRPRIRERQPSLGAPIVFAVFTIIGVMFIISGKLLALNPFVVTFAPVGLMITYAIMILAARALRLRDDQTGDNFYYMGFIFTLTSLGVSLYQFGSDAAVDEIVRNFGIAVASTIAGIALRIFFSQMRRDPIEVENVARQELAEASRRVRRELDGILMEMAHFRRTNQQMLAEGFDEIRVHVQATTKDTLTSMRSVADDAMGLGPAAPGTVEETAGKTRFTTHLQQTAENVQQVNATLGMAATQLATAAAELTERIKAVTPPEEAVEASLRPIIDDLKQSIVAANTDLDRRVAAVEQSQAELTRAAQSISTAVEQLAATITSASNRSSVLPRPSSWSSVLERRFLAPAKRLPQPRTADAPPPAPIGGEGGSD